MVTGVLEPTTQRQQIIDSIPLTPEPETSINHNTPTSTDPVQQLIQALGSFANQTNTTPRFHKALSTTMPTFDGKNEKFEHFEDLFNTSLTAYPKITEKEKIHYFHSLLRKDALQTFQNLTTENKNTINDVLAAFRRRYVRIQSVATARCKWDKLCFDPSTQKFQDFLGDYQKLAHDAFGDDANRYIQASFYAKMPYHLKRVLNQVRLENATYEEMTEHIERDLELNGAAPEELPLPTFKIDPQENQNNNQTKRKGNCHYCNIPGHHKAECRKYKRDTQNKDKTTPNQIRTPCDTCGRLSHSTQQCYNGANWANRPEWWRNQQPPKDETTNTQQPTTSTHPKPNKPQQPIYYDQRTRSSKKRQQPSPLPEVLGDLGPTTTHTSEPQTTTDNEEQTITQYLHQIQTETTHKQMNNTYRYSAT